MYQKRIRPFLHAILALIVVIVTVPFLLLSIPWTEWRRKRHFDHFMDEWERLGRPQLQLAPHKGDEA